MPFQIRTLSLRRAVGALAGATALIGAVPAVANACTLSTAPGAELFAKYGDNANYVPISNGFFSNGTTGWSLTNATLLLGGAGLLAGDGQSLSINQGGSAISPKFCVAASAPSVRFMLRTPTGNSGNTMNAYLLWTDWGGVSHTTYIQWVPGAGSWTPSPVVLAASLPLWESGNTLTVRLQLVPQSGGAWSIDDLFEDPYSRG